MLLVSVAAQALKDITWFQADVYKSITVIHVYLILLNIVVPLILLAVNVTVVHEVRRLTNTTSSAHLRREQRQPSTSSTTSFITVPTVTLLTASLIYVLVCGTWFILYYVYWLTQYAEMSSANKIGLKKVYLFAEEAHSFVFSCIFYVYLIRRKQFRSDLYKLFCHRRSAAAAAAAARAPRQRHAETCV